MSQTNFQKVAHLNNCFGNTFRGIIDWESARKQLKLIQEEMQELADGVADRDFTEVRDAIADVLVTTYGMAHILGIDADADMEAVQQSNLSKLCTNSDELQATMDHYYTQIGIKVYSDGEEGAMYVKSAKDQDGKDGKHYPAHKFLKCVNWHEPVLD